ncbi:MAG: ABC transporter substrate-binding protein [Dehalococcoidia bacterium]
MAEFRIQPHSRLQEWVAEEKGYFKAEGLDYEFVTGVLMDPVTGMRHQTVAPGEPVNVPPQEVKNGAFESMADGRACEVSAACHWAVNQASSAGHGIMWGHAYSITPSGLYVAPEAEIRSAGDLARVPIAVGYHSGSHFSTLQSVEKFLKTDDIKLQFVGGPNDRLGLLLDRRVQVGNVFGAQSYVLEQQGFRKIVDTTFMIGFLFSAHADLKDVERYFNALRLAQRDIDRDPGQYKHYFLKELAPRYHQMVDLQAFGPGERLVFEPYTEEMYRETHRWMASWKLFPEQEQAEIPYESAVATG